MQTTNLKLIKFHTFKSGFIKLLRLQTLSSGLVLTPKDLAVEVMWPLMTILLAVLGVALYNWQAKKPQANPIIIRQLDKKYSSDNLWTFKPSSLAKILQESTCWASHMQGFQMIVPLEVLVLYLWSPEIIRVKLRRNLTPWQVYTRGKANHWGQ